MQKNMQELLNELMEKIDQLTYVRPDEIPSIDLYMDQVLTFLNERMLHLTRNPKEDKIFTKTMINNYAKTRLLPAPVKKKYSKDHILLLIFIYYFKGILSINDTDDILGTITENYFGGGKDFGLEDIYQEVFHLEANQIQVLREDIMNRFHIAETTFENAPEEDKEFLKTFSFICLLSFDVYVKKMLIEKLIDSCCSSNSSSDKSHKKK